MNRNIIEKNIVKRMEELKMKQRDIVHITGMSRQEVSHCIHDRQYMGVYPLYRIAKALDCKIDDLLEGINITNNE